MKHFYDKIQGWFDFSGIYAEQVRKAKDKAVFVEVGAWRGKSTAFMGVEIYNSQKDIMFDVVDTFEGSGTDYQKSQLSNGSIYQEFMDNIEPVADVMNILVTTSLNASLCYDNETVDFVFIDASHEYEDVLADIKAWWPKIKKGGTLAGHDYNSPTHPGVTKAVNEVFDDFEVNKRSWVKVK